MSANISGSQRRVLHGLLDQLIPHFGSDSSLPARIERLLRSDRRFGSRDRRLYRELLYATVRFWPWVERLLAEAPEFAEEAIAWLAPETPSTLAFRHRFLAGWPPCPDSVADKLRELSRAAQDRLDQPIFLPSPLPAWAADECPVVLDPRQCDALHRRAPLWLRIQAEDPAPILAEFSARGWHTRRSELLAGAVRVDAEADLAKTESYRRGLFEVQDLGSQLILECARPAPGTRWLDACAGAGGKSLQLASLLGPSGAVDSHDVRSDALDELERRAERAGLGGRIRRMPPQTLRPGATGAGALASYDGVLVDAPCSGSGTWRRSPHLKWTTTPASLVAGAELQLSLLAQFAAHVSPGGRLIYATCSLCPRENEWVAAHFLTASPGFSSERPPRTFTGRPSGPGLALLPADHDGDGFFVACFRRNA